MRVGSTVPVRTIPMPGTDKRAFAVGEPAEFYAIVYDIAGGHAAARFTDATGRIHVVTVAADRDISQPDMRHDPATEENLSGTAEDPS